MKLKKAIQKDGQRHLYVKSAITSETTQYKQLKQLNLPKLKAIIRNLTCLKIIERA